MFKRKIKILEKILSEDTKVETRSNNIKPEPILYEKFWKHLGLEKPKWNITKYLLT